MSYCWPAKFILANISEQSVKSPKDYFLLLARRTMVEVRDSAPWMMFMRGVGRLSTRRKYHTILPSIPVTCTG